MAQQPTPEDTQAPNTKKEAPGKKPHGEKPQAEKPQAEKPAPHGPKADAPQAPKTNAPQTPKADTPAANAPAANQPPATNPAETKQDHKGPKNQKNVAPANAPNATAPSADQSAATSAATPDLTKQKAPRNNKNAKNESIGATPTPAAAPKTSASVSPAAAKTSTTPAPTAAMTPATTPATATTPAPTTAATTPAAGATMTPATTSAASAAPSVSQTQTNSTTTTANPAAVKKVDPQKVQQIRQQHQTFTAQPRPDRVPAVTFNQGYRIQNSDRWQGPQYEVYRSYHPERHDQGWYRQHYQRVELIAGGYYYFNNGYWAPAWGYDSSHEYYAYDAPIYAGKHALPPDKVIADVQAALQEMGYYRGEVDGLLGPLTREALTGYQRDSGMTVTAVIDEPTLDALGMSS